MYATLVAIVCHSLSNVALCQEAIIGETKYGALAGKVDDPIQIPGIAMRECEMHAQLSVAEWLEQNHPTWWTKEIKCVPGRYVLKRDI